MPIELKTVYTKDRLLKFYKVVAASKKWFWILMTICSLLVISASVFLAIVDELTSTTIAGLIFIVAMDITYIILYFVSRFSIKKSKILNTVIDYTFDTDTITSHSVNSYLDETSTVKYSLIFKVIKKDYELYLFTARNSAMLVDISSLSSDQIALLKNTIESQIASKKINWKD